MMNLVSLIKLFCTRYILPALFWIVTFVVRLFTSSRDSRHGYVYQDHSSRYTFDGTEYILPEGLDYPPYPDLQHKRRTFLAAECDGVDVTGLAQLYAGPRGNFYHDLGYIVTPAFFDGSIMVFLMTDYTVKTFHRDDPILLVPDTLVPDTDGAQ